MMVIKLSVMNQHDIAGKLMYNKGLENEHLIRNGNTHKKDYVGEIGQFLNFFNCECSERSYSHLHV